MSKAASVYGIYPDANTAHDAVAALTAAGFREADISVMLPDNVGSKDFGHEKHTKAPEGAVAGGGTGALVGAAVGWLAGAGSLMVPGLESLSAAGPIMAALSGIGAGVVLGGVTGALVGMGVPEYEAKRYAGRVRRGGILLSVHCDDQHWTAPARSILMKTGAVDISVRGEAPGTARRAEVHRHEETPAPRS